MRKGYTTFLLSLLLTPVLDASAQAWGYQFPVGFGVGVKCASLMDGGVFMHSSDKFVRFEADGTIANSGKLNDIGALETVTQQPNGHMISVSYTADPGGQPDISFPLIARHSPNGTMLWGISYPDDTVSIFRPTQVLNAADDRFYVNFTGRNFHRLGYFEGDGQLIWMQQFDGLGFPVQLALDPSGRLYGFNGASQTRYNTEGFVEWETYHMSDGHEVIIEDVMTIANGFVFAFRYQPEGTGVGAPIVPGIGLMDSDGTITSGIIFKELSGDVWETMGIATTATGYMMTAVDYTSAVNHTFLFTCNADLSNAMGYEVPLPSPQPTHAIAHAQGGMLIAGASSDFFTSDRFVFKLPANGEVSGCFTPVSFTPGTLVTELQMETPFPTIQSAPDLAPASDTRLNSAYTVALEALCIGLGVGEEPKADVAAYPNPSNGRVTLDLSAVSTPYAISVVDPLGRVVVESSGLSDRQLVLSEGLRPGLNHIRIIDRAGMQRTIPLVVE